MTRIRTHRTKALAATALVIALGAAATAEALSTATISDPANNIKATFSGGASPKALPKKGTAPVTLIMNGAMSSLDGSHLRALNTISLDFDKAGVINTTGLAQCSVAKLESTTTKNAEQKCRSAIVGKGEVTADVVLPEQAPLHAKGPLVIFNGKSGGAHKELILHVYARVPAPTTFVVAVKIKKEHKGKYGTNAFIKVPSIVHGGGSVTSFKAKIRKTWSVKGKKQSLLNAGCPNGSLAVAGEFKFVGDSKPLELKVSVPCTPKG